MRKNTEQFVTICFALCALLLASICGVLSGTIVRSVKKL